VSPNRVQAEFERAYPGGDADTTACMAGALAGAYWGVPAGVASWVLQNLPADMRDGVLAFEARFPDSMRLVSSDP
jgi:ADP-ribosylglycohydrolase